MNDQRSSDYLPMPEPYMLSEKSLTPIFLTGFLIASLSLGYTLCSTSRKKSQTEKTILKPSKIERFIDKYIEITPGIY
jgi:hypothetical protein